MILRRADHPVTVLLILGACLVAVTVFAAEGEDAKILRVEGDVQKPVKIHSPAPVYPPALKKEGIEGQVIASTVISQEGKVESVEIVQTPHAEFGDAVRDSLSQWEFEPATLDGRPVPVYYQLTINFKLAAKDSGEDKPIPAELR